MTSVTNIPYSKIDASDAINARPDTKEGLDELSASIASRGLIQPLAVRPTDTGRYEVIDGRRRFRAMGKLVKAKTWKRDTLVPVIVRNEDDAEALATSLIANSVRLPMHPVDQHEVFERLTAQGQTPAAIAASFAIAEKTVRQHLALSRLAPEIRKAWKAGKIDERIAKAFTMHPDHEVQAGAYARLAKGYSGVTEDTVRRELAGNRPKKTAVPAPLLERYYAAGGTTTESLFDDEAYLDDGALLKKVRADIAAEALAAKRAELLAQGWAWVAEANALPLGWRHNWDEIFGNDVEVSDLSEADQKIYSDLEDKAYAAKDEADADRLYAECDAIMQAADLARYTPEMRARSGAVIAVDWQGKIEVTRGVIRPSADGQMDIENDAPDDGSDEELDDLPTNAELIGDGEDEESAPGASPFATTQALSQSVSEIRTKAAAQALTCNPDLAMRIITAALTARHDSPAHVRNEGHASVRNTGHDGNAFAKRFAAVLKLERGAAEQALAMAVASTLDLTDATWKYKGRDTGIDDLVSALDGVPFVEAAREHFNAVDYFFRAAKAVALAAIDEMREAGAAAGLAPEDALADMKKGELAKAAADAAILCGWLPPELRHPAYAIPAVPSRAAGSPAGESERASPNPREATT